ncbi:MAG: hypothetical protein L0Z53_20780 [Acidobacteriales bacterium]|nr:hypothetical protein [Terriglobales bacterium]
MAFLGIVIGVGAAMAMARTVEGLLYGISANDPWTHIGVAATLAAAAMAACYIPARRATRVDPLTALRYE